MIGQSFLGYKGFRWLWVNVVLVLAAIGFYIQDYPLGGHSGSTLYGYSVGILCFLLMLALMWYGLRKRAYHSRFTTLQGSLSFHVWTGLALLILVPLHAGFRVHNNIHTLAFVLMVLTILSGIFGALVYRILAPEIPSHRGSGSLARQISQVEDLSQEVKQLCSRKSDVFLKSISALDVPASPSYWWLVFSTRNLDVKPEDAMKALENISDAEVEDARKAVALVDQKIDICRAVGKELRTMFLIRAWLFMHVPLSFGVVAAVLIHIFVVLYMR